MRLKQICNFDPATGASAKLERLEADLEEIAASGRKAIVFSQWVGTLQDGWPSSSIVSARWNITARCRSSRRDAVIQQFRDDPAATCC